MTIQTTKKNSPCELVPWRVYGDGRREAQILSTLDAAGRPRLVAETRPVAAPGGNQDTQPVHPAEVKLAIPALAHDALRRHAGNARVKLTTSPSLNHLTVGLRDPHVLPNGWTFSGSRQNNQPHGYGWAFDPSREIHYIGTFEHGKLSDDDARMEHPKGWYEGSINGVDRKGAGVQRGPERLPDGQPVVRLGEWHNNGLVDGFRHYPNGDWFVGKFTRLLRTGNGVLCEKHGSGTYKVERRSMGRFDQGHFVEGTTWTAFPNSLQEKETIIHGRWTTDGDELPGRYELSCVPGEEPNVYRGSFGARVELVPQPR